MSDYFKTQNRKDCCGCSACAQKCPYGAISMVENENGFKYPIINQDRCTHCNMCSKVCPFKNTEDLSQDHDKMFGVYMVRHADKGVLKSSTSGGAFSAIAKTFCDENYVIFGACFDENMVVRHKYITSLRDLHQFHGSKYVQSDIGDCYRQADEFLQEGRKVLFSGTPCQIAGLRNYLGRDYPRLLCVDLICHGVPSPLVLRRHIAYLQDRYRARVKNISFRDKNKFGWLLPCNTVDFIGRRSVSQLAADNCFEKAFLNNICLRESCYHCKFAKAERVGDLTIGDFWGADELYPKIKNRNGLSLVLVNTDQGNEWFERIKCFDLCIESNINKAAKQNKTLKRPAKEHPLRSKFFRDLRKLSFDDLIKQYFGNRPLIVRIISVLLTSKMKRWIRKIFRLGN